MQTKVHSHDANTFGWLEISRTRHGGGGGGGGGGGAICNVRLCVCVCYGSLHAIVRATTEREERMDA